MVKLNKIYTRTGDAGETSLVNGMRVSKHARRPSAFGEVDEANSVIGLARLHTGDIADADAMLARIQNDLFDLGADIATPETDKPALRITSEQVTRLETEIDMMNAELDPLGDGCKIGQRRDGVGTVSFGCPDAVVAKFLRPQYSLDGQLHLCAGIADR